MIRILQAILAHALLLTAPLAYCVEDAAGISPGVLSAVADPRRPADQTAQDIRRKPGEVIAFAGVKAGDRVVDFMPGGAYFTRLLSDVVTSAGHVYAFLPTEQIKNCSPSEIAGTRAVEHDTSYRNVTVVTGSVDKFAVPVPVDVIWTAQNYHDLHDRFMGPANIAIVNKAFFDALRPGGVLLVIDHAAEPGSGVRDTETLHRIDPAVLRREIESAGFVYEASSNALANADDDHRRRVFDAAIRGRTDQIVYRFRKPAAVTLH
jgi:predicted methyltransferase